MNNRVIQIIIGLIVLVGLTNISCKEDDVYYNNVLIKNETSNYLCVLVRNYYDNQPCDFEGGRFIEYIEPSGIYLLDYLNNNEIDSLVDRISYKIIFIEAVNPKEINMADILSRAVSNEFKITTKWYTLKELRAMDWTIVYDGIEQGE